MDTIITKGIETQAMVDYLQKEMSRLNNIETCKSLEEMMGRQEAIGIIKGLIKFIDKKEEKEQVKNQYL
jgi:hypothetical protein